MEKEQLIPSKSNSSPSPEMLLSSTSSYSSSRDRNGPSYHQKQLRSKSLSNISAESYSQREITRIRERLLR